MTWTVVAVRSGDRTRHIVPVHDLVAHEAATDCVCGPREEGVWCPDGMVGWVILHHALDGRPEYLEQAKPNDEAA